MHADRRTLENKHDSFVRNFRAAAGPDERRYDGDGGVGEEAVEKMTNQEQRRELAISDWLPLQLLPIIKRSQVRQGPFITENKRRG